MEMTEEKDCSETVTWQALWILEITDISLMDFRGGFKPDPNGLTRQLRLQYGLRVRGSDRFQRFLSLIITATHNIWEIE